MRTVLFNCWAFLCILGLSGCSTFVPTDVVTGDSYKPTNVHRSSDALPPTFRRVAVLPLAPAGERSGLESGAATVDPLISPELVASGLVEAVDVSGTELARWTGRPKLRLTQELPAGVIESVRKQTACDGILFGEVTQFSAFPPLSVGLRLSLVDVQSGRIVWSVDEVYDAGNPAVAAGARRYFQSTLKGTDSSPFDSRTILDSPTRFSRYVVSSLISTMPKR